VTGTRRETTTMMLIRIEPGHYRTADGRSEVHRVDRGDWVWHRRNDAGRLTYYGSFETLAEARTYLGGAS
jgi:hypothetical protein